MLPDQGLKLQMALSTFDDIFVLFVNGQNFLVHPYKYDLTPEGDDSVTCVASAKFND